MPRAKDFDIPPEGLGPQTWVKEAKGLQSRRANVLALNGGLRRDTRVISRYLETSQRDSFRPFNDRGCGEKKAAASGGASSSAVGRSCTFGAGFSATLVVKAWSLSL